MKIITSLFFVLLFSVVSGVSQPTLLDVGFTPVPGYTSNSNTTLRMSFKLFNPSQAQSVEVKLSTENGDGDISDVEASVINTGNVYAISFNGNVYDMGTGNYFEFPLTIPTSSYENMSNFAIRVKYSDGSYGNWQELNIGNN